MIKLLVVSIVEWRAFMMQCGYNKVAFVNAFRDMVPIDRSLFLHSQHYDLGSQILVCCPCVADLSRLSCVRRKRAPCKFPFMVCPEAKRVAN